MQSVSRTPYSVSGVERVNSVINFFPALLHKEHIILPPLNQNNPSAEIANFCLENLQCMNEILFPVFTSCTMIGQLELGHGRQNIG